MTPIDFSKLGTSDSASTVLHPREIFTVLRKDSARYQYPRDVQAEVWDRWYARRGERDLVIKMNTGGGKTVVGLLILKGCLNEGKGPAVYITPDPYLTRQVILEGESLGLGVTDDAYDPQFRRGQAILVANIYKLINGKSVFGVADKGILIPIGSLVVDDAHACLATTEGQFTMRIEASNPAYTGLFRLFREDLRGQSATGVLDIEANDPNKDMLVPYWAWLNKAAEVVAILHPERESKSLEFPWPLLKDVLSLCQCTFGGGVVEIAPRCLPMEVIPSFTSAGRRVFMTATLADDSVLVTHFDVSPDAARTPITPSRADDVGDRLILIPQELNPAITDQDLRDFVTDLADAHNVVVIVPSHRRAALWQSHSDQVLDAKGLAAGIERLRAEHVGLTVIVNKYDGIDLPDDACRVLVLDGLPDVRTKIDRIEQSVLHGSAQQATAMVQRIEQGMGRGVRSNADRCVVLLMGRSLTHQLYTTDAISKFTPTTRAQYNLSQQIAAQLRGRDVSELRRAVDLVLGRDREWTNASRGALVHVKYDTEGHVSSVALAQRSAFNAARARDWRAAAQAIQGAVNAETDVRVRGWLRQQLAECLHSADPVQSQLVLRAAAQENRLVVRPMEGIDYQRLRAVDPEQGPAAAAYLAKRYPTGNHLLVGMHGLLDQLKFEPDTAPAFERSMAELALMLGFESQRPEAEYGRGPDVLWSLGGLQFFVIECKNGAVAQTIAKSDANQLSGSTNWFSGVYDASCKPTPVMVHPSHIADRAASPHAETRVITVTKLDELRAALEAFALAVAAGQWPPTARFVGDHLTHHGLSAALFLERFTVRVRTQK